MLVTYQSCCRSLPPKGHAQHLLPGLIFKGIDHAFHSAAMFSRKPPYGVIREPIPRKTWMPPFMQDFASKQGEIIAPFERSDRLKPLDPEEGNCRLADIPEAKIVRSHQNTLRKRSQLLQELSLDRYRSDACNPMSILDKNILQTTRIGIG